MTDEPDDPSGTLIPDGADEVTPELFLADGEMWIADAVKFCKRHNLEGFQSFGGGVWGLREGSGRVPIDDILKESKRLRTVK